MQPIKNPIGRILIHLSLWGNRVSPAPSHSSGHYSSH